MTPRKTLISRGADRSEAGLGRMSVARHDPVMLLIRSRTVWFAKILLPVVAIALLGVLAVLPTLRTNGSVGRATYPRTGSEGVPISQLREARYHGVNAQGEKFEVRAAKATQVSDNLFRLWRPSGDITLDSGTWLMLSAVRGLYHQKEGDLQLNGKVTLYRNDGITVHTQRALIDLHADAASGDRAVLAYGPFGTLHAESGFAVMDGGVQILFRGRAQLILDDADSDIKTVSLPSAGALK